MRKDNNDTYQGNQDPLTSKIIESQVISYLKASGLKVGLLVNFGNRKCEVRRLMINK
jgi:hypothetical protein